MSSHIELAKFIKENMREPRLTGGAAEVRLARWLQNQRAYYRKTGKVAQEYEEYLGSNCFTGILRKSKQESLSNQKTALLLSWMMLHNRHPSRASSDPQEEYLGTILDRRRSKGQYYPSDEVIASEAGFPNLFESKDRETNSNMLAIQYCEWVKSHDRMPDRRAGDAQERMVANWYWNRRSASLGNSTVKIYESDTLILEKFGLTF